MKTVSTIFEWQKFKQPQFLLRYILQGLFNGLGFICQTAFEDFEGKTGA